LLKNCAEIFNKHKDREKAEQKEKISQLYKSISELKYENDWIKKIRTFSLKERLKLFEKSDRQYSMLKQCALLGINRTTLYYKPVGINNMDCEMMNLLYEQYTKAPFCGVSMMREFLRSKEYEVGKEHFQSLLRKMGFEAIYPRMNLSKPRIEHKVYPYVRI